MAVKRALSVRMLFPEHTQGTARDSLSQQGAVINVMGTFMGVGVASPINQLHVQGISSAGEPGLG